MVSLNSDESVVSFYYLTERNYSFGDLAVGFSNTKITSYYWRFTIADSAKAGQSLDFFLLIFDDSSLNASRINTTVLTVGVTDYQLLSYSVVEDCYDDDCYGCIAAGGDYVTNITIVNVGQAIAHDVEIFLYANNPLVTFSFGNGSSYDFDYLLENEPETLDGEYFWDFSISEEAKAGQILNFTIIIRDALEREWFFYVSIEVVDGPNTFYYTPLGKIIIFGSPIAFFFFLLYPNIRTKIKKKRTQEGGQNKSWLMLLKERHAARKARRMEQKEQKQKMREALQQERERKRIANINQNETELLQKFEAILKMTDSVNISDVAKSLGLRKSQLFEKLI